MNRTEKSIFYHDRSYNCCQSVIASFSDITGLSELDSLHIGNGFGRGAGSQELCGAITGAIMALNMMYPLDSEHIAECKSKAASRSVEFQKRFQDYFEAVRCEDLLNNPVEKGEISAVSLGITGHCAIMISTAVGIVEEMLKEDGII